MKRILLLFISLLLVRSLVFCQAPDGNINGKLVDTTAGQNLPNASISVINRKDSSLASFTLSDQMGIFRIKKLQAGEFSLLISLVGYQTLKKDFSITRDKKSIDFGMISLLKEYKTLKEIVISDESAVKVKGDTIAYKARAFKTKPNATVEDLLKKLPGMQVEKDGTVKAQGEKVQKVYVDGKEFFGSDPKLATKNLLAEMIDQVEVFDDMSEQAKFNRIDDGTRSKAINLKLKKEKRKGTFGKIYGGYGSLERYDAGISINFFKGASQVSLIAKANNTNNFGFTMADMTGMFNVGSGNKGVLGGMQVSNGGIPGALNIGGGNGITSSWQAGLNYRDTWSKSFDMTGSYFFNHANTDNQLESYRQIFFPDSSINRSQQTLSKNKYDNHHFNFSLLYTLDSLNSILYSANLNFQSSSIFNDDTSSSHVVKNGFQYRLNNSRAQTEADGNGINWSNNLLWRKKFHRAGRTLSVNLLHSYGYNVRDGLNKSFNNFYDNSGDTLFYNIFNQQTSLINTNNNYITSISYTEPLAKNKIIELYYSYSKNQYESDKKTYDFDSSTSKYSILDGLLTNEFQNLNESNRFGTNFRVIQKKYNFQLGLTMQKLLIESNNLSKDTLVRQKLTNFFPTASINYQVERNKSIRINYRGRTNQPSISQLQPVPDLSNPLYIKLGNPRLKQEFTNNINFNYSFFNTVNFHTLFAFISFSNTYNKIANATETDNYGVQTTQPVNLNGVFNTNGNFTLGFPIKKMSGGNFNMNTRVSYYHDANLVNSQKNYTKNLTIAEDMRFNFYFKECLDLGFGANISYNSARYTIQENLNADYFTHTFSSDFDCTFFQRLILSSDIDYTFNTGRTDGYNQNFTMWNASLALQLFKNNKGEFKFSVFDILGQNVNINRNVGENYVEDVKNKVLQRFYMLTLTYNLRSR